LTKEDFVDWKRHPVTQQVFSQLKVRVDEYMDKLVYQAATADPRNLAEYAAIVRATQDIINIEYEGEDSSGY
jgi:hypothetical protein